MPECFSYPDILSSDTQCNQIWRCEEPSNGGLRIAERVILHVLWGGSEGNWKAGIEFIPTEMGTWIAKQNSIFPATRSMVGGGVRSRGYEAGKVLLTQTDSWRGSRSPRAG